MAANNDGQNPESSDQYPRLIGGVLVILVVLTLIAFAAVPAGRRLVASFVQSLREPSVQTVNVDLSGFVGPYANRTVQHMISAMISSNVTTIEDEKSRSASNAVQASELAGFRVQLLGARHDAPQLRINGRHAFRVKIDRSRLQSILNEAGRSDLKVPPSVEGAIMTVQLAHSVRARYGDCPRRPSAAANIATPPPSSTEYATCVLLTEGPPPKVQVPAGLSLEPLAEIGLQAAGMTGDQAHQFLHSVHWRLLLGVTIPRALRSYASVKVDGVHGTLFNLAGRRGPTYMLIWIHGGIVFSLTGYGDSGQAVSLANTVA